ncbi:MAG TPA: serine hydrolase domain-containing protein [Thermoanaerobaculia bacterium]|jgi:CubicO group peptidase (beta-lactamase class C family)
MKALLVASLLLAVSCAHAPSLVPFEQTVEAQRVALKIPSLSVAVVRDGKIVLAKGFGSGTADTLYPIGSITKTFTSTLMLQLAEEGRLELEADVAKLVDWEVNPRIHIRHVLSHTSGGEPGTRFAYSSRFNWLDNVVEAVTKESFAALLRTKVIDKAGLTRTIGGETGGLAQPFRIDESGNAVPSKLPPLDLHSSSGLSSTVVDLAKYSIALDEGRLLPPHRLNEAFTPSQPGFPYGLGWYTQTIAGQRVVWHPSWWPDAFSGLLVKVPEQRLTLVLLANTDGLTAPQRGASNILLYPIARAFLEAHLGGPQPIEVSDDDRLRLYEDAAAGRRLLARFPDDLELRFNVALAAGHVRPTFRLNGAGAAEALQLLEQLLAESRPLPRWMQGWTNYLVAEHIAPHDPTRARQLAEKAKATTIDTDNLQARIASLLAGLP